MGFGSDNNGMYMNVVPAGYGGNGGGFGNGFGGDGCCCCARNNNTKEVLTYFGANIAIPEGGTVGAISVAIAVDGATVPFTTMTETPAAVNEFSNVSRVATIPIFRGCCQSVTVRNISDQPIIVNNPNFGIPENGGIR